MSFRYLLSLFCIISFLSLNAQSLNAKVNFEEQFKLKIIISDSFQTSFENINYDVISSEKLLNIYITDILIPEFKKYPESYFKNINLKQIVLCKSLNINNQFRAAIPDPLKNTLLLSIDSIYSKLYKTHVLHHELHHITEYALWQDMYFDWKKWQRKNTKDFAYGTGGQFAYIDGNESVDWYKINHPKTGFVNLYSTLGQEEDRCEIVALLMTDEEGFYLREFIKIDKNLKRKVNLTLRTLAKISNEKLKYWKAKLNS